jgi:hypothetical protein
MTTQSNGSPLATIREAAKGMGEEEARYLVDLYYQIQDYRKASDSQIRAIRQGADEGEPSPMAMVLIEVGNIEEAIKRALDTWTDEDELSAWAKGHVGVGPVLAAGLAAHIDVTKATTAGAVWRFAGLDPTLTWGKGEKRPYNARLKVLCWKLGDSFVKQSGHERCRYGHLYRQRKEIEVAKNEAGDFAEQARQTLEQKNIREKGTRARYEEGKLPDGRIDLRARRWAVKLFLAHYWQHGRELAGLPVPDPYPIAHLGHAHEIKPDG